jgi:hypothetical protein
MEEFYKVDREKICEILRTKRPLPMLNINGRWKVVHDSSGWKGWSEQNLRYEEMSHDVLVEIVSNSFSLGHKVTLTWHSGKIELSFVDTAYYKHLESMKYSVSEPFDWLLEQEKLNALKIEIQDFICNECAKLFSSYLKSYLTMIEAKVKMLEVQMKNPLLYHKVIVPQENMKMLKLTNGMYKFRRYSF